MNFSMHTVGRALLWGLLGIPVAIVAHFLAQVSPQITHLIPLAYIAATALWLLSWPYRRRPAGGLLFSAGRPLRTRFMAWIGVFEVLVALFFTVSYGFAIANDIETNAVSLTLVLFWWTVALLFLALGSSALNIRENGLCFLYTFTPWERLHAYCWQGSALVLHFHPHPVRPKSISLRLRTPNKEALNQVLSARIRTS